MQNRGKDHLAGLSQRQQRSTLGTKGEGPQSGGDEGPSGAGAKRKEGVQPPEDCVQDEERQFSQGLRVQGDAYWNCAKEQAAAMTLGQASKQLCSSTALLLRLANASKGEDAIVVRRWLRSMGIAAGIAAAASEAVDGWSKQ
ncbi:hypothetical protein [Delftia sp. HK171]|uniref:hypothetical protein n=1 Tax=Delftia sp. HK171 TaxID=1920191 RepID=UPI0012EBBA82|nr:hypothetical protein [Delftia sp. HK171]